VELAAETELALPVVAVEERVGSAQVQDSPLLLKPTRLPLALVARRWATLPLPETRGVTLFSVPSPQRAVVKVGPTAEVLEATVVRAVVEVEIIQVRVDPETHPPRPHLKVTTVQLQTVMVLVAEVVLVA